MKKIINVLCVALCALIFSCGGGESGPVKKIYNGIDAGGTPLILTITDNSTYELIVGTGDEAKTSTGTAAKDSSDDTKWILTPYSDDEAYFTVTLNNMTMRIDSIDGTILDDDGEEIDIGEMVVLEPFKGKWVIVAMDDSQTKKWAPGISSINYTEDADDPDPETGEPSKKAQTKTVTIDGEAQEVFYFQGITEQKSPTRTSSNYKDGAGWPLTGWLAMPDPDDEETQDFYYTRAYAYSFWIKINTPQGAGDSYSAAYVTSIDCTVYTPDEGFEPGHWFGTKESKEVKLNSKGNKNFTQVPLNQWAQVMVIFDRDNSGYNMDKPKWLYDYPPADTSHNKPFDRTEMTNIKWQIQLQHNGGTEGGAGVDYSVTQGMYDFDVEFYGLELYD